MEIWLYKIHFNAIKSKEAVQMGGRPSKPASVIKAEGKSHRTKAELEAREAAEKALLTGQPMTEFTETKKDKRAHAEFVRLNSLLGLIDKNDDLYSSPVNRYCMIYAEAEFYRTEIDKLRREVQTSKELTPKDKLALLKQAAALDGTLTSKRREMLALEKEMCLTLASSLRAIPKDAGTTPAADPLMELLKNRNKADIDDDDEEVD